MIRVAMPVMSDELQRFARASPREKRIDHSVAHTRSTMVLQYVAADCTYAAAVAALVGPSLAIRPSTSSITRSQRAARRGSCVTTRNEIRSSACMRRIYVKTSSEDA